MKLVCQPVRIIEHIVLRPVPVHGGEWAAWCVLVVVCVCKNGTITLESFKFSIPKNERISTHNCWPQYAIRGW